MFAIEVALGVFFGGMLLWWCVVRDSLRKLLDQLVTPHITGQTEHLWVRRFGETDKEWNARAFREVE